MRLAIIAFAILPTLGGCSTAGTYFFRPTNYTPLPQNLRDGERPAVGTLSLDASRRLMIAPLEPGRVVCSEPPPDAATSLLAKAALEGSAKPTGAGEFQARIADEFAANAALIAKRTAAVEFWRTTSFSYCQFLMNGWTEQAASYLSTAERIAPQFAGGGSTQATVEAAPGP